MTEKRQQVMQGSTKHQMGVGLVELMITVTIGLVIMAGVLQLYASSTRTAYTAQGASRIQENMRYAMTRLGDDIASAGNMGCFSFAAVGAPEVKSDGELTLGTNNFAIDKSIHNLLADRLVIQVNPSSTGTTLVVDENGAAAAANDTIWNDFENSFLSGENNNSFDGDDILNDTDTLIIKSIDAAAAISILATPNSTSFQLENINNLSNGDTVFASDCDNAYVFALDDVDDGNDIVSIASGLNHAISAGQMSFLYAGSSGAYRYYIGGTGCASDARENCSLLRSLNGGTPQELVRGVHDLQISYGHEETLDNSVATNGRLTVDRVQVTMAFNAFDPRQPGQLLTKTVTRVFAVRNQL